MRKLRFSELIIEPEFTGEDLGGDNADGNARRNWGLEVFGETGGLHCEAAVWKEGGLLLAGGNGLANGLP